MHELSIARSIVETCLEHAEAADAAQVRSITIRLGVMTCVHKQALEFSFAAVSEGTLLDQAVLHYIDVPIKLRCASCHREFETFDIQSLRCPECDRPCHDLIGGDDLEIEQIEIL